SWSRRLRYGGCRHRGRKKDGHDGRGERRSKRRVLLHMQLPLEPGDYISGALASKGDRSTRAGLGERGGALSLLVLRLEDLALDDLDEREPDREHHRSHDEPEEAEDLQPPENRKEY